MSQVQSKCGSAVREHAAAVEPEVDVLETAEGYMIVADVPGVARESLDVEYEESVLRLRGSGRSALGEVRFERSFRLGDDVDIERASATVESGVATVVLPRLQRSRPRRISVSVG